MDGNQKYDFYNNMFYLTDLQTHNKNEREKLIYRTVLCTVAYSNVQYSEWRGAVLS